MKWSFSIRALLALITGAAIAVATYFKLASIIHQEQAAVARIEQHNGKGIGYIAIVSGLDGNIILNYPSKI